MQFTSKNPGYQLIVKEPEVEFYKDGRERVIRPIIVADFAAASTSDPYRDPVTGETYTAMSGGGFLDTVDEQRRNG